MLQELLNKQIIIEKQQENLLETVRGTIKETDPPQIITKSKVGKNKEPRKKAMILGDSIVKGLNEYGLSKNQNIKVTKFFRIHHRRYVRHRHTCFAA